MIHKKLSDSHFLSNISIETRIKIENHRSKYAYGMKTASRKEGDINLKRELARRYFIGCFTICYDSKKMWEKFGNDYSGCVMQFNFKNKTCFHQVHYSDVLPRYNNAMCFDEGKHFMEILCHKKLKFSWEQEIRYVVSRDVTQFIGGVDRNNTYGDLPFENDEFLAIYLGCNIDTNSEAIILSLLKNEKYRHVKIYKMQKNEGNTPLTFKQLNA